MCDEALRESCCSDSWTWYCEAHARALHASQVPVYPTTPSLPANEQRDAEKSLLHSPCTNEATSCHVVQQGSSTLSETARKPDTQTAIRSSNTSLARTSPTLAGIQTVRLLPQPSETPHHSPGLALQNNLIVGPALQSFHRTLQCLINVQQAAVQGLGMPSFQHAQRHEWADFDRHRKQPFWRGVPCPPSPMQRETKMQVPPAAHESPEGIVFGRTPAH